MRHKDVNEAVRRTTRQPQVFVCLRRELMRRISQICPNLLRRFSTYWEEARAQTHVLDNDDDDGCSSKRRKRHKFDGIMDERILMSLAYRVESKFLILWAFKQNHIGPLLLLLLHPLRQLSNERMFCRNLHCPSIDDTYFTYPHITRRYEGIWKKNVGNMWRNVRLSSNKIRENP